MKIGAFKGVFTVTIINMSLKNGVMPCALKVAVLKPLLKKQDADFEQLQSFRPISNLTFVSKLIEKVVALQLNDRILRHHLDETFQSAYIKHFTVLKRPSLEFIMIFSLLLITIILLFYFYSTYLLPLTPWIILFYYQGYLVALGSREQCSPG